MISSRLDSILEKVKLHFQLISAPIVVNVSSIIYERANEFESDLARRKKMWKEALTNAQCPCPSYYGKRAS